MGDKPRILEFDEPLDGDMESDGNNVRIIMSIIEEEIVTTRLGIIRVLK